MGADYVDEHRLIRYRGGEMRDITAFVSDLCLTDELDALSPEVSFGVIVAPWDKYVEPEVVRTGDKVKIVNHSAEVFSGVVTKTGLDGKAVAYNGGWYLSKSTIILQVSNMAGDAVIRQACSKAGVGVASICSLPCEVTQVWVGETVADIIEDVLEAASAAGGKRYQRYVDTGGLVIRELPQEVMRAYHKPAENLPAYDITWALGQVEGEDSIDELRNAVVIAAEDGGKAFLGAQGSNSGSIEKYGFLQHVETVSADPGNAALAAMVKNLLAQYDRVGRTRTVREIWGADEVRSGVVLNFNSPAFGVSGRQRVTRAVHHYGGAGHTMELELAALDEPRAAAAGLTGEAAAAAEQASPDKVQIFGLPDGIGGSSDGGVTTGGASGSAAAFVAAAQGEVGYNEGAGNRTKYGTWFGMDGVAWCVIFVCWCAAQSGAPIPTRLSYVGDMSAYFKARGKYKASGGGYIPKAGDLMIQTDRHIGIVKSATAAGVQTVEGNYSNGVRNVTRGYGEITGFCTPWG